MHSRVNIYFGKSSKVIPLLLIYFYIRSDKNSHIKLETLKAILGQVYFREGSCLNINRTDLFLEKLHEKAA